MLKNETGDYMFRCPFHNRKCIFHDCGFYREQIDNYDIHSCCDLQMYLDDNDKQKSFNDRLNELIADAGGYE